MEREIAAALLDIGAVFLQPQQPFTWASGIKSPIYCDNRLTLAYPAVRTQIEEGLAALIEEKYPECQAVYGTATAGIAHAAITAHLLCLPMGYVRTGAKDHGRGGKIEGRAEAGQKVVVVEDLISTGGSAIAACETLRLAGCQVLGIASIFTYGMQKGKERLAETGLAQHSLCSFDTLVQVAAQSGRIAQSDIERLIAFRDAPEDENWMQTNKD